MQQIPQSLTLGGLSDDEAVSRSIMDRPHCKSKVGRKVAKRPHCQERLNAKETAQEAVDCKSHTLYLVKLGPLGIAIVVLVVLIGIGLLLRLRT